MTSASIRRAAHQLEREKARQALGLPTDLTVSALHAPGFTLAQATHIDLVAEGDAMVATLTKLAADLNVPWSLKHFKAAFLYDLPYRVQHVRLVLEWFNPSALSALGCSFRLLDHASYRSRPSKVPGGPGRLTDESQVNLVVEAVKLLGGEQQACTAARVTLDSIHNWIANGWRGCKSAEKFLALAGIEANRHSRLVQI